MRVKPWLALYSPDTPSGGEATNSSHLNLIESIISDTHDEKETQKAMEEQEPEADGFKYKLKRSKYKDDVELARGKDEADETIERLKEEKADMARRLERLESRMDRQPEERPVRRQQEVDPKVEAREKLVKHYQKIGYEEDIAEQLAEKDMILIDTNERISDAKLSGYARTNSQQQIDQHLKRYEKLNSDYPEFDIKKDAILRGIVLSNPNMSPDDHFDEWVETRRSYGLGDPRRAARNGSDEDEGYTHGQRRTTRDSFPRTPSGRSPQDPQSRGNKEPKFVTQQVAVYKATHPEATKKDIEEVRSIAMENYGQYDDERAITQ